MYQSPPSVPVWTRRHWIAAIGAGALGASIAMEIIIIGGGVVADGRSGIVMGGVQALIVPFFGGNMKVSRLSIKARRWMMAVLLILGALFAIVGGLQVLQLGAVGWIIFAMGAIYGACAAILLFSRSVREFLSLQWSRG